VKADAWQTILGSEETICALSDWLAGLLYVDAEKSVPILSFHRSGSWYIAVAIHSDEVPILGVLCNPINCDSGAFSMFGAFGLGTSWLNPGSDCGDAEYIRSPEEKGGVSTLEARWLSPNQGKCQEMQDTPSQSTAGFDYCRSSVPSELGTPIARSPRRQACEDRANPEIYSAFNGIQSAVAWRGE
jgi:hypothetical protein